MIGVDTNVLVYAHREDSPHHTAALSALRSLAERGRSWGLPWPCVHEFLAIVTHPRIYDPSSATEDALAAAADLLAMPGVVMMAEGPSHFDTLERILTESGATGPKVHDAWIAAICLAHGVDELWSADRDFSYFPELGIRNPLVAQNLA